MRGTIYAILLNKKTDFLFSKTKDWLVLIILLFYISGTEDFLIC